MGAGTGGRLRPGGFTHLFDRVPAFAAAEATGAIGTALVTVGAAASLTMGANEGSNATALFLTTGFSGPFAAGLIGGVGLAVGVLTWGRPLLELVAFDVIRMDRRMVPPHNACRPWWC